MTHPRSGSQWKHSKHPEIWRGKTSYIMDIKHVFIVAKISSLKFKFDIKISLAGR